ncbi:MAG: aldo/keto reductase, partial [Planctomycetota bacterium]
YGYGTSEEEFGQVLPEYDRDKLIIQTKGVPEDDVNEFVAMVEESFARLKTDRLDLFGIHGINTDEFLAQVLQKGGVLDALLKMKAEGRIGAIGFSSHGLPGMITRAIETGAFDYVNLWHSYIYPFNVPAIEAAKKQDMGVFIISPNDKGGMLFDPPEKFSRLTSPLHPMTFNDIFILSNPDIHTISCGAAKAEDFDVHVEAVEQMEALSQTVADIARRLDGELETVIDSDWAENYLDGVPDWRSMPESLNVPISLWLWNLVKAFDLIKYGKMRYNLMGNAEHWFPGCKPAVFQGMDKRLIRAKLAGSPYADRIMDILQEAYELMADKEVKRISENE